MQANEAPESWIPFLTADDLSDDGCSINLNARRRVSPDFAAEYPNGLLRGNELLVKVKGPNQTTAYNSNAPNREILVSGTIWGAIVDLASVDPHFLVAVLTSSYGGTARTRLRTNTNVEFLAPDDLLGVLLPWPKERLLQQFIGEKLRLAEKLREHAKAIQNQLQLDEISMIPVQQPVRSNEKGWRISGAVLNENRLDSSYYQRHYLETEKLTSEGEFRLLSSVVTRFRYGASIEADYVPTGEGVLFLRGNDIDKNRIDRPHCVDIRSSWLEKIGDNLLKTDMVVITRSGTVGIAVAVPEDLNRAAYGSFVISLELSPEWNPVYVAWFLNSWLGRMQTERLENGAVQLNINIQELGSVRIWKAPHKIQQAVAGMVNSFNLALDSAHHLTSAAKLLIEALINGKISAAELVSAQEALVRGDNSIDRVLLSRLTRQGLDVSGSPPLFPDLDALYSLLAQTAAATQ
jgi:hypothetical protein